MSKFNFNEKTNNNYENQNKKGAISNLKPEQKVLMIIAAVFVVGLVAYSGFISLRKSPATEQNTKVAEEHIENGLLQNKTFQGLAIQNIEIESTDSLTHLMANITNNNQNEFPSGMVDIVFLDSNNKEMGRVPTYIDTIASGGQLRIDTVINKEYKNAANFKVEAQS